MRIKYLEDVTVERKGYNGEDGVLALSIGRHRVGVPLTVFGGEQRRYRCDEVGWRRE